MEEMLRRRIRDGYGRRKCMVLLWTGDGRTDVSSTWSWQQTIPKISTDVPAGTHGFQRLVITLLSRAEILGLEGRLDEATLVVNQVNHQ